MDRKLILLSTEKTIKDVLENTYSLQHAKVPQSMKTRNSWIVNLYLNWPLFLEYFQVIKATVQMIFENVLKRALLCNQFEILQSSTICI